MRLDGGLLFVRRFRFHEIDFFAHLFNYTFEVIGIGTFGRIEFCLLLAQKLVYLFLDVGKPLNGFLHDALYVVAKMTPVCFRIV